MDRATLEYPVKPGLIFCLDRAFPFELNEIIVEKAIAWRDRGVVGVDIAGPESATFRVADYRRLMRRARQYGLGITIHTGEAGPVEEVARVIELLEPDRIGHGVKAAYDPRAMAMLRERGHRPRGLPDLEPQHRRRVRLGRVPLDLRPAPPQRGPLHDQHRRPGDAQDVHPRRARDARAARASCRSSSSSRSAATSLAASFVPNVSDVPGAPARARARASVVEREEA